jgi:hypothetical protein
LTARSVVIVGVAARAFQWAPDDEVWAVNRAGMMYPRSRLARWFHLHGPQHILAAEGAEHLDWLKWTARPRFTSTGVVEPLPVVYTPRGEEQVPGSHPFPYRALLEDLGAELDPELDFGPDWQWPHMHNSFPLLIALAVMEGVAAITLDGVQFGYDRPAEAWAIPAIEWHLGRAAGKGIAVRVPLGSGLMVPHHLYGLAGPGSI